MPQKNQQDIITIIFVNFYFKIYQFEFGNDWSHFL